MIYFCADDYGISKEGNNRIENCLKNGVLNKISVLPNGEITDFENRLSEYNAKLSLHINLVEGKPLSESKSVDMLVTDRGYFKYSFAGLFLISISSKRKMLEEQLYKEIQSQIRFWKNVMGETTPVMIDSHQHTHMIPLVFKTLMRVIRDEKISVQYIRIPSEPISPYVFNPSLYFSYSITGIVKQWVLKMLSIVNRREFKKSKIPTAYFMGVMLSGKLNKPRVNKLLSRYSKIAEKNGMDIEIGFHPAYSENGEKLIDGHNKSFEKFYFSPWRKIENNTLLTLDL